MNCRALYTFIGSSIRPFMLMNFTRRCSESYIMGGMTDSCLICFSLFCGTRAGKTSKVSLYLIHLQLFRNDSISKQFLKVFYATACQGQEEFFLLVSRTPGHFSREDDWWWGTDPRWRQPLFLHNTTSTLIEMCSLNLSDVCRQFISGDFDEENKNRSHHCDISINCDTCFFKAAVIKSLFS